jgi:hypothetical protein
MKKDYAVSFRNPRKRDLTNFMARQLLYDYATKKVDPLRERAVAGALEQSPELAKHLDDIIYGMTYCHHLKQTQLSGEALRELQNPLKGMARLRKWLSFKSWPKSAQWLLQSLALGAILLFAVIKLPWPDYYRKFLGSQHPRVFVSESPRELKLVANPEQVPADAPAIKALAQGELSVVNQEFTVQKLIVILPRLGASIEHSARRQSASGQLVPYLRLSIPNNQTEALFSELRSQGQLTIPTLPSDNDSRGAIFGMELWILQQKEQKGTPPSKDHMKE